MRARAGFTLVETLIASAVALMLATAVILIFIQVEDGVSHSTERVDLVQRARIVTQRLQPLLAGAVSRNGFSAITVEDEAYEELGDEASLTITTVEDYLALDYDIKTPFRPLLTTTANHFRVRFVPEEEKVIIEQLRTDMTGQLTPDPSVPPRTLGSNIQGFGLQLQSQNALQVLLRTEGPEDTRRPQGRAIFQLEAVLPIPYYTGR